MHIRKKSEKFYKKMGYRREARSERREATTEVCKNEKDHLVLRQDGLTILLTF